MSAAFGRKLDDPVANTAKEGRQGWRLPAREIERVVGEAVNSFLADRAALTGAVRKQGIAADRIPNLLKAVSAWCGQALDLIERVDLDSNWITINMNLGALSAGTDLSIRHIVPARIRRRGVEMRLALSSSGTRTATPDPALIRAVARAHKWFDDLASGRANSLHAIAKTEGLSDRYVARLLPLAFLAPDIVEAIFAGTQPVDLTAEALTRHMDPPLNWADQKVLLGFGPTLLISTKPSHPSRPQEIY